jgi:hypothetical protein
LLNYSQYLQTSEAYNEKKDYSEAFEGLQQNLFESIRNDTNPITNVFRYLLSKLDSLVAEGSKKEYRAGASGLEASVLECLCNFKGSISFSKLAGIPTTT